MPTIDWDHLSFSYSKTDTILTSVYEDGKWGEVKSFTDDNISLSAFSGALHYGVSCFEGLKAFRGVDGKIRLFRPEENARRMRAAAKALFMPSPPESLFLSMCERIVRENLDYLPPYGHGASLYIRPLLFAHNGYLGVSSSGHVTLCVMCSPVGAYVGSALDPITAVIARNHDRAASFGMGKYKVSANYACSLPALHTARFQGYKVVLHLDPTHHRYIDEFNSSNFFAIKDNTYITPLSDTILPSITNKSLCVAAKHLGMEVRRRKIEVAELSDFDEVGECGTAVVITPVSSIDDKPVLESDEVTRYSWPEVCGPKSLRLYKFMTGLMYGEVEDTFGWCRILDI